MKHVHITYLFLFPSRESMIYWSRLQLKNKITLTATVSFNTSCKANQISCIHNVIMLINQILG